jgi:acyl-CoA thioester hydrolase
MLHCDGHVVAVWVDRRTGKPTPLPAGVRRASELLLETAQ